MGSAEQKLREKDVSLAIKYILSELEMSARTAPEQASHPYECDRRRKVVIKLIWNLYRRLRPEDETRE